jgi:hypothetical protein
MPSLESAVARYAAAMREAQFAAEAEALIDRTPDEVLVRVR